MAGGNIENANKHNVIHENLLDVPLKQVCLPPFCYI